MTETGKRPTRKRKTLTRKRVLEAAVELADRDGLESLSMRNLGSELGVEAMSLYNHIANKDDLLDGIVDLVTAEFEEPRSARGDDWRALIRGCAITQHDVLLRHPWAAALAESRAVTGPVRLRYYDALLGLRYRFNLSERWSLDTRGDASFGDSEGTLLARASLAYTVGAKRQNRILIGYQYKQMEFLENDVTTEIRLQGPVAGFNFRF